MFFAAFIDAEPGLDVYRPALTRDHARAQRLPTRDGGYVAPSYLLCIRPKGSDYSE